MTSRRQLSFKTICFDGASEEDATGDEFIALTLTHGNQGPNNLKYDSVNQSPGVNTTDTCILLLIKD